jgi:hypothetical protein
MKISTVVFTIEELVFGTGLQSTSISLWKAAQNSLFQFLANVSPSLPNMLMAG